MYPIFNYAEQIVDSVKNHHVTIIVGETGCGKSTQIMPILDRHVASMVVTQPRRLAAISLAKRVSLEQNWGMPDKIGYVTGTERLVSPSTSRIFCTDGVEVTRTICGKMRPQVLVLDEIHEMNLNMEVLMAWQKKIIGEGSQIRLVIMSATMKADDLSRYFWNAPIIEIEGRAHPVEDVTEKYPDTMQFVKHCVQDRKNVLVFVPGKAEIDDFIRNQLGHYYDPQRPSESDIVVCSLHGDMTYEQQLPAFKTYGNKGKFVVATNVAQTSITIEDIDCVLDSQLERVVNTTSGAESLVIQRIPKSSVVQRMGRAGRTKPGEYFSYFDETGVQLYDPQLEYSIPEIQRLSLDKNVLRLMSAGIDPVDLEFFHDPGHDSIIETKQLLFHLGAIDKTEKVTAIGKDMLRYPLDARSSRIMVQAVKLGNPITMAMVMACMQVGGIYDYRLDYYGTKRQSYQSDLEMQYSLFFVARKYDSKNPCPFEDLGINRKAFFQALQVFKRILSDLWLDMEDHEQECCRPMEEQRTLMHRAYLAGMRDNLLIHDENSDEYQYLYPKDSHRRTINNRTIYDQTRKIEGKVDPLFAVGVPYNLQVKKSNGTTFMLYLINWPASVTAEDIKLTFPDFPIREQYEVVCTYLGEVWVNIVQTIFVDGKEFKKTLSHKNIENFNIENRELLKELCVSIGRKDLYQEAYSKLLASALKHIILTMGCYVDTVFFKEKLQEQLEQYSYESDKGGIVRPISSERICEEMGVTLDGYKHSTAMKQIVSRMKKYIGNVGIFQERLQQAFDQFYPKNSQCPITKEQICAALKVDMDGCRIEETADELETVEVSDNAISKRILSSDRIVPAHLSGVDAELNLGTMMKKVAENARMDVPVVESRDEKSEANVKTTPRVTTIRKPNPNWTDLGKRNWRCACGKAHRHGKNEHTIVCDKCGDILHL